MMAVIGVELDQDELVLTKGRDFKWAFVNLDASGAAQAFPDGTLYFELYTSPGVKGQIAYDADYQYTCIADNSWKRSPLSTW